MTALLVIRHGKTQWNQEKKLQGQRDIPLCNAGRQILKTLSLPIEFSKFKWVSSPLSRATETAQLLGAHDLALEDPLIEMDWGDWEGHRVKDLRERFGSDMEINEARGVFMKPPGGESPAEVQRRILPWLAGLREPTVAITHKGIIRAMKSLAYQWDMTDKSPVPFDWQCAHLFNVDQQGALIAERVNIRLEKE